MFRVIGDVLEYDGKPFAVVTMPLSGQQITAIEALEGIGFISEVEYGELLHDMKKDVNRIVKEALTATQAELWLTGELTETMCERVQKAVTFFFKDTYGTD